MDRRQFINRMFTLLASGTLCSGSSAQHQQLARSWDTDVANGEGPAKPWVYGFWIDGNITKEGITADLEAMAREGVGGLLFMDGAVGGARGPHRFMSDSWQEHFRHMATEASRLGLQINLNNGPGWSGSPGPWITPALASQVVVYRQTVVEGPSMFDEVVPRPAGIRQGHYQDIALLAYPLSGEVPSYRIHRFDSSKSFAGGSDFASVIPWPRVLPTSGGWPVVPEDQTVDGQKVQELTAHFQNDRLRWNVPLGKWLVLRFGHTVANGTARAAQAEANSLECDKLKKATLDLHFAAYVARLVDTPVSESRRVVVSTHIDSWEAGSGNWTPGFQEEFQRRRGYDMLPYMATLAGFVVNSLEKSERFLWDLRDTVAELVLENYAEHMAQLAHAHKMRLSIEGYDGTCDDLRYLGRADEPMSEFNILCYSGLPKGDLNEVAASAAHVYGKPIVGCEAFTSWRGNYLDVPATLKAQADWAFCAGINRLYFSEWVMQPWSAVVPGVTLATFGTPFQRNLTWWPQSKSWHEYVGRCQEMLRKGQFVADICFVTPEGAPYRFTPPIPATIRGVVPCRPGYNFDGCPPELVIQQMEVEGGEVTLPSGMRYRLLVLPTYDAQGQLVIRLVDDADYSYKPMPMPMVRTMTPALLRRIKALVEQGAVMLGWRPLKSPSLSGFPDCDMEVTQLADELWGVGGGIDGVGERQVGRGRVCWGRAPEEILSELGVPPDFSCSPNLKGMLNYTHRREGDGTEIYFVVNKSAEPIEGTISLRVQGKQPEVLWPQSGKSQRLLFFLKKDGITEIPITLGANESVFFVFREKGEDDPVVAVTHNGQQLWPAKQFAAATVDPEDDSFMMAAWVQLVAGKITLPVQKEHGLAYETNLKLPGPGFSIFTSPGQGRAGFAIGTNGIVIFRYTVDGWVEPLLVYAAHLSAPVHVGVLYSDRTPRLFLKGKLVMTGAQCQTPFYGRSGWEDRRPFAGDMSAMAQFDAILAAAGFGNGMKARNEMPALGYTHSIIWNSGDYQFRTSRGTLKEMRIDLPTSETIEGSWRVQFEPEWGGPANVVFERLEDWSLRPEPGIKYYSGVACYRKRFSFGHVLGRNVHVYLDLGRVADSSEVILNGASLGILWNPPYRIDVTDHLQRNNELEVRVVNRWINRMIGDEQLPEDTQRTDGGVAKSWPQWLLDGKKSPTGRMTFSTFRLWKEDSPLIPSGLLGPVRLRYGYELHAEA